MRTAVLIVAVIGSAFTVVVGSFSGSMLAMVGCAASRLGATHAGADATAAGSSILYFALLQSILGIVAGIHANKALGRGRKATTGGILLLACSAISLGAGVFTFLTGGLLHLIAGILAMVAKPKRATG